MLALLLYVMVKFRASANPTPSRTSHNSLIEVIWTLGPVVILLALAIPSFNLLTAQYSPGPADITVKATGYQWYWGYEYQTEDELSFDSLMLQEGDRAAYAKEDVAAYPRLLAVDNELVVPVGQTVRLLGHRRRCCCTPTQCRLSASRWTRSRAVSTRPGSRRKPKACITDSAPSCAARITPICRLRCVSLPRTSSTRGLQPLADDVEAANRNLMAAIDADAKSVAVAANDKN